VQPHLTDLELVTQSFLCHPDWDLETHLGYLKYEEAREDVDELDVEVHLAKLRESHKGWRFK